MYRPVLPFLALATIAGPAFAADVTIQSDGPVVELSVTETVKSPPDMVDVSAGVSTRAATAVEAMRLNAQQMTSVIRRIKALGIPEEDIQTAGITLNPQYDYDRTTQRQVFKGYEVGNRVNVTLRDVDRTGPVLDALVEAGATDLNGPSFAIDDETQARAQAREAALRLAKDQANEYARLSGFSGIRLLQISEAIHNSRPMPMMRTMDVAEESAAAKTPVQPGLVGTSVNLTVTYEMTR